MSADKEAPLHTADGQIVDVYRVVPENFSIENVATALSNKCRFGGQTSAFYSVAQHCMIVSNLCPAGYELAGLLHELDEVFLPDVPTPLKNVLPPEYTALARDHLLTGAAQFGVHPQDFEKIHAADRLALAAEANNFMGVECAEALATVSGTPMDSIIITPMPAIIARDRFISTYNALRKNYATKTLPN